MSDSASAQGVAARKSPRGSLIQMAIVIGLAVLRRRRLRGVAPCPCPGAGQAGAKRRPRMSAETSTVVDLPPIVTNLGAPQDTWVRLEGSIIFDPKTLPHPEAVAGQIGDDILAYLRTISLHQLEGPIGLENIRQDLNERAATRSGGKVRALVIKTLVVQ